MERLLSRCVVILTALTLAACAQPASPPPQAEAPAPQTEQRADAPADRTDGANVELTQSFALLAGPPAEAGEAELDDDVLEAGARPTAKPDKAHGLDERSRALVAESDLPAGHVGFVVIDQDSGVVLAEHNADRAFIPASVAKVPTSVVALDVLGGGFNFRTVLAADGPVKNGTLHGDLYLWGGGDPMLDSGDLRDFVRAIEQAGIKRVDGRFVYDDSYLVSTPKIDPDQPDDAGYNPSIGALSLGFNRVQLKWGPGKNGGYTSKAIAHSDQLRVPVDTVSLKPAPDDVSRFMRLEHDDAAGGETWIVGPSMRNGGTRWLPVRQPGNHTATVLREVAQSAGVALPEPQRGRLPHGARTIYERRSDALADILPPVLDHSNNMATELIGMVATREMLDEPRTLGGSGAATADWLRAKMPLADWSGFMLANHSGLSTRSRITPNQMAAILGYALDMPHGGTAFASLMPREWKTAWARRSAGIPGGTTIRAKTGTMYYARGLAGLIRTEDDRRLLFAFFANDPSERAAYDANPNRLAPSAKRPARRWLHKAKALERDLIGLWSSPPPETLQVKPRPEEPAPAANKAALPLPLPVLLEAAG